MAQVPGSTVTLEIVYWWIFCFHVGKPMMSISPQLPILRICEKLELLMILHNCGSLICTMGYVKVTHSHTYNEQFVSSVSFPKVKKVTKGLTS